MKRQVYWFSGTGNSLKIAKDVAKTLDVLARSDADTASSAGKGAGVDDTTQTFVKTTLLPIAVASRSKGEIHSDADMLIIVFPVYFVGVPDIVVDFLRRLRPKTDTHIHLITNCGETPGNVLLDAQRILLQKGFTVKSGTIQFMPDNSLVFPSKPENIVRFLQEQPAQTEALAKTFWETYQQPAPAWKPKRQLLSKKPVGNIMYKSFKMVWHIQKKKCDPQLCTTCGICAKVCPVGNISKATENEMNSSSMNKMVWGNTCAECFACIHWCPVNAVQYGRLRLKTAPVKHPDIQLKELCL